MSQSCTLFVSNESYKPECVILGKDRKLAMQTVNELHLTILEKPVIECSDIEQLLGDLVDGDLTPTLEGRIRDHIEDCDCCRESEKSYRWVVKKAKLLKSEPLPNDVSRRLRMALNEKLGLALSVDSK